VTTTGKAAGNTPEDELLGHRYRQITDAQAARYAASYDADAGLARFTDWLQERTAAGDRFSGSAVAAAMKADADTFAVSSWPLPATPGPDADLAAAELYSLHYKALIRLAVMLVRDVPTAEEVVQDAFVGMRGAWDRLGNPETALAYLRQAVVNRARSVLRHRTIVDKNRQEAPPDMPSAKDKFLAMLERSAVVAALRQLPDRQREAIVLRYYADLPEADIAATMGITRGAAKSHLARGMAALRAALEEEPS
jgi:RNA polymerase sigma-70 factor (sigma-E family)